MRQRLGQVPLAPGGRGHPGGEGGELLQRGHPEVADPLDQGVQDVDRGAGVGQGPVVGGGGGAEEPGQGGQLAVAGLVPGDHVPGQPGRVEHRGAGQGCPVAAQAACRKPMSNGALCATSTAPRENSRNAGSTAPIRGRRGHHRVGDAGQDGDERRDRLAGVHQGLELAEHLARRGP